MAKISTENWMSLADIAKYLGVSKDTVRNWIKREDMPAHKLGRLWKFKRVEIEDWISERDEMEK